MDKHKTVIYTAIFGQKDNLQEPLYQPAGCDFVCFTDQNFHSKVWKIVKVSPPLNDPTRSARQYKILVHRFFPDYEYSVWIDGNVVVRGDVNKLIGHYLKDYNMAVFDHSQSPNFSFNCLYDGAQNLLAGEKIGKRQDDPEIIKKQVTAYRQEGYPAHNGLIWSLVLLRRHQAPDVIQAMEAWWAELEKWSKRDQMSFNYMAWKTGFRFVYISGDPANNEYFRRMAHYLPLWRQLYCFWLGVIKRIKTWVSERQLILKIYRRIKFFGFSRQCVICGAHLNIFFPAGFTSPVLKKYEIIGGGYRLNVRCPHCRSSNRERLIYLFLKQKEILKQSRLKILHFAPEKSLQQVLQKLKDVKYVSADLNSPLASQIIDVRQIPYPDDYFDLVICSHVLEHVPEDDQAIKELYRVTKKDGVAIIQVPISSVLKNTLEDFSVKTPKERYSIFGQEDHVRIYGQDYPNRLKSAGFTVILYDIKNYLTPREIETYGLDPEEKLFVSSKN